VTFVHFREVAPEMERMLDEAVAAAAAADKLL
jgi:hypothetical protein